ncbi:hypothetical protein KDA14_03810, partial [Candidatus Saccharibacteria bacterium]|nr:hypothetical protein [Candidatus Saccharibacteria bacterium]
MGALPNHQPEDDIEPDIRPHFGLIEGGAEGDGEPTGNLSVVPDTDDASPSEDGRHLHAVADASSLKDEEENPTDGHGPSAEDTIRERLGLGYTGGDSKDTGELERQSRRQRRLSKMFASGSRNKRTIAVATAAGGVLAGIIVAIFLALLPLKMEAIIKGIEAHYGASVQQALDTGTEKLVSQYFAKYVLPAIRNGTCHSTIDATCVSNVPGSNNPIQKAFRAFHEQKIERKLAERGVLMGKKNGKFYVTIEGSVTSTLSPQDIDDVMNFKKSLFDMDVDSKGVSRNEFRKRMKAEMREAMKDMNKRDRIYMRFKFGAFLEKKYGLKRCWIACKLADDTADKLDSPKFATKFALANLLQRVITPRSEEMGIVLGCVTAPATCGTDVPSREGDTISEEGST